MRTCFFMIFSSGGFLAQESSAFSDTYSASIAFARGKSAKKGCTRGFGTILARKSSRNAATGKNRASSL